MYRPQTFILYEKTIKREYQQNIAKNKQNWQIASHILAGIYNTAMGNKRKQKSEDFMPEFEENPFAEQTREEELMGKAEKLGLKTPSTKKL